MDGIYESCRDKEFYYWIQQGLDKELSEVYKKIHRVAVFKDKFYIWFLNNEDSVAIPLETMRDIYNRGKSIEELTAIIDTEYIARIRR